MSERSNPDEYKRALAEGAWLLQMNRPGEALDKLLPLYEQSPSNPDVALNVGGAYILQAKWDKAVRVLSQAAELHPDNAMIWTNLGAAYLGRLELAGPRQQERAIKAYERALQANPQAPNVHYHLGLIYKERGEFLRACAFFQRALEVNAADKDAQHWLNWIEAQVSRAQTGGTGDDSAADDPGAMPANRGDGA